ncbi:RluA family pseudouridine synthase [Rummeliibacillus sp. POC4]|uniref:RluA family pseudouridine synthase n=1 Tax=Rummeliibacillus sp. POC4 TaxID=2305899 RepID=UPI000E671F7A|nr:RluA family pseudouridine synthase [Rummeliibacillus sp. POC4]RIJ67669.1 RluA family pseudouridine synthase [Rummeliibacillus sp. POC4]
MQDLRYRLTFTAQKEQQLLREALADIGVSKRALTAIKFQGGALLVNGKEQNVRFPLNIGDEVTVIFPMEEISDGLLPESGELAIKYEDDVLLILEKPPYQSTIPSHDHPTGSIANFVAAHLKEQQIRSTVHVVTRLDRDTSGLMCIAKHRHIHHLMSEAQKKREIHRTYEALVHGEISEDFLQIIAPIGRKDGSIIEREVREDGKFAHTDVQVLNRYRIHGEDISHVRLNLHTGRTHQIRVHMASIGHPLLGDDLYGGKRELVARQALHCVELELLHPLNGQTLKWTSEFPEDIRRIYE